ncbi:hypothetical protein PENTCL1PPCAC_27625, partial [Pristionchus entomophagus]
EKSSTYVHTCPLCGSVRTGTSSLGQHLGTAHNLRLDDVGRWIHCAACDVNFAHDATWRLHLAKMNCPTTAMTMRWREQKRDTESGEQEMNEEAALVGLDGRSRPMLKLKKRKSGKIDDEVKPKEKKTKSKSEETEEEAKLRRQKYLLSNRNYMRPKQGWVIVQQSTNFRCTICGELGFPTIPSLVWHQRQVHSVQLSQLESWIHCSGCDQEFASLSSIRGHVKDVTTAAAAAGEVASCSMSTTAIAWQVEETSEEARMFLAGLDPMLASSRTVLSSISPGIKLEPFEVYEPIGGNTIPDTTNSHKRNQRVDKSYILPRPGYEIVRRKHLLVCQMCGEARFPNIPSIDHHMRKVHRAGFHQAGMWVHCGRCTADFCNMSSVRAHVAYQEGVAESCNWDNIYMCWHEMKRTASNEGVKWEVGEDQEMEVGDESSDLPCS